ncbi:MAG TPA: lipopolysaccharide heptosyltransferase II [Candidatus Sulfotelmatobacter sp.]|nr:lipopolysaccharide heptosyltransferase II [Candidatus Sulfotelmatobacter sp.]
MNLLIRATNWVGDAIMALPALRAVRGKFPDSRITIVARPYVADLYRDQAICDELIPYDLAKEHRSWRGREMLAMQLRAKKFDVALLLQNAFDAAWLAWRAAVPERIGYARDGRSILLTKAIRLPKPGEIPPHEKFYYLELLRRAGWIDRLQDDTHITLHVPDAARHRAMQTLVEAGARPNAPRVAVGAGASYGSAKCWPPDRFAKALNEFLSHADADVVLFGTAAESAVSSAIASALRRPPIDLTGETSIADLPGMLSQCHLFLGNDSGAMHVAAAVGLPVVAVFGPTDPQGTAPVTPRASIVQQKPYCSPCFLRRCPTDHRCMTAVTPAMVEVALHARFSEVSSA